MYTFMQDRVVFPSAIKSAICILIDKNSTTLDAQYATCLLKKVENNCRAILKENLAQYFTGQINALVLDI